MNRLTGRANIVSKVNKFIEFGGDLNFAHTETKGSNASFGNNGNLSSLRDMAFWCPTMDYVDPVTGQYVSPNPENSNGTYGTPIQGPTGTYDALTTDNLLAEQMEQNGINKDNKVLLSSYANITFFKGLTFKSIASYTLDTYHDRNFYGNTKRYLPDGVTEVERHKYNDEYILTIENGNSNTLALESFLTYNWNNDVHNVTLMAGNSVSRSFGDWSSAEAREFPGGNIRDISLTSDPDTRTGSGSFNLESRRLSYFGRATYNLMNRYILTGTIRRDGSSNFGVDNRWGTFPSAAFAWRISEENFMNNASAVSNLKLRLGWGQTGNAGNIGNRATASLTSNTVQYFFYPQDGVAGLGTQRQLSNGYVKNLVDTRLKWETNEQSNIGVDFGLFNSSINITVDYFTRSSKDLLLYKTIRPSAGHTEVYTNYGEIHNQGVEFSLNYNKQISSDVNFSATVTGSTIKNEIKSIGADQFFVNSETTNDGSNIGAVGTPANVHWDGHSIMREGYAIGSFYGYEVEGIFQTQAEVDAANAMAQAAGPDWYQQDRTGPGDFKYKDLNGDGYIDPEDMTILGDGFPKLNLGLNLSASYKNWDVSVYSYGVFGVEINSYSAMTLTNMFGSDNETVPNILNSVSDDAWTPQNGSNETPKLSLLDYNRNMRGSDAWIKKGDYYKISTLQIGYNLGHKLLAPLSLESARINVSIQNLLTISSYKEYGDPEIGQGDVKFTGLDTGRYPMPRIYSLGVNIQF
jgi:TonB-linked SusC/RagA family outer membrane protein